MRMRKKNIKQQKTRSAEKNRTKETWHNEGFVRKSDRRRFKWEGKI